MLTINNNLNNQDLKQKFSDSEADLLLTDSGRRYKKQRKSLNQLMNLLMKVKQKFRKYRVQNKQEDQIYEKEMAKK